MADTVILPVVEQFPAGGQVTAQFSTDQVETSEPQPEEVNLDISISNVVCSFSTKCHLNLKKIAMEGSNVEYHRQHGVCVFCYLPL